MQAHWELLMATLNCPYKAWILNRNFRHTLDNQDLSLEKDGSISLPLDKLTTKGKLAAVAWYLNQIAPQQSLLKNITIYNSPSSTTQSQKVKISQYLNKAKKLTQTTTDIMGMQDPPSFYRNSHCPVCQFKETCYKTLKEKDCISILGGMTTKVLSKYHKKGIFTITQLSHLFKLRRRRNKPHTTGSYLWELKALALREKKTYVLYPPELPKNDISIFIDFESLPEENRVYLIGALIKQPEQEDLVISYWVNDTAEERDCFAQLLTLFETYPSAIIYHYGSFETKNIKRARVKWPELFSKHLKLEERTVNLLSYLRTHVYPPAYSNGLKELATLLGFRWRGHNPSGSMSIEWRKSWERTKLQSMKKRLIHYNEDDCKALVVVKEYFDRLALNENQEGIQMVSRMKKQSPYKFQANPEFGEDYQIISKASYFEYQRNKIYWRTENKNKAPLITPRKGPGRGRPWKPPTIHERIIAPLRKECPFCGHKVTRQHDNRGYSYIQTDLKFTSTGITQWAVEYYSNQARCLKCWRKFNNAVVRRPQLGDNVFAWAINLYVNYNISYKMIGRLMQEQFSIFLNDIIFVQRIHKWWSRLKPEAEYIWKILLNGPVIHIDETSINIIGHRGYVWVFAANHTVFYHLTLNRESTFLQEWLKGYSGVIVTDFFPGYDALPVKRQKCLIHLIRDLNDDLFKNPFDKEFADLVAAFSKLLRAIIQTIDTHGLIKQKLAKHQADITAFKQNYLEQSFSSEYCTKYTKRLQKHWGELWTFLEYDGVPWNNNNAEAAIKAFAQHRHGVKGVVTEKGLRSYLEMLSMAQTCRYRNVSFLDYLRRKTGIWQNIDLSLLTEKLPFEQARLFVQGLNLNNVAQWESLVNSDQFPSFLPTSPHEQYENVGWAGYPDFLGLKET